MQPLSIRTSPSTSTSNNTLHLHLPAPIHLSIHAPLFPQRASVATAGRYITTSPPPLFPLHPSRVLAHNHTTRRHTTQHTTRPGLQTVRGIPPPIRHLLPTPPRMQQRTNGSRPGAKATGTRVPGVTTYLSADGSIVRGENFSPRSRRRRRRRVARRVATAPVSRPGSAVLDLVCGLVSGYIHEYIYTYIASKEAGRPRPTYLFP